MTTLCYLGLGANIDNPVQQLLTAVTTLAALPGIQLEQVSSLYGSKPVGPQDQPDYVNAVACIRTCLAPLALLDNLQQLERDQGRVKLRHWGERCIDVDILLYGDEVISSERLTVPHSQMALRSFVLLPLMEIAPALNMPDGRPLSAWATKVLADIQSGKEAPLVPLLPPPVI
ncbi:2-amino-4-hydroxy-6-hydroxymethyldihydropteridine diphosphokinase [Parathalassolituus penaei]|uniref:2-amino-4-hydroxy-6-hydroxymethyldihydropteridine pyrophosphokinase n=1 Tax=Parathalassolituus penaei TaxID=2997323 RepID=A0A9X3ISP6_9GAMM|nr:2-amino-4-hydroxy-6-hydroxymethyldihydropteridine diphosphokinase [Parathalassolituus penaei]MCY0964373.1 2-amino-4-hydroxy-6-hydroxymethyldihydropteridine diphosphokinase [Parathalassolituus penaei]